MKLEMRLAVSIKITAERPGVTGVTTSETETMLQLARRGETTAVGRLLQLMRPRLLSAVRRSLGSTIARKASESDIVQGGYAEAIRDFGQFRGTTAPEFEAWITRVVRNHLHDVATKLQRTQRRAVSREERGGHERLCQVADPDRGVLAEVTSREEIQRLRKAISNLPDQQQQVLRLRHAGQLSFADIARRLGCSKDRTRRSWHAAIERLKVELAAR